MKDAVGTVGHRARSGARPPRASDAEFSASGKTITFHGFLKAYVEGADDPTPSSTTASGGCRSSPRATR